MSEYITMICTFIVLAVIAVVTLIPKCKRKEVKIVIHEVDGKPHAAFSFNGYTNDQQVEILNLLRFEALSITNKMEDYEG